MVSGSADLDFGVGEKGIRRDRHVLRRGSFAHAPGGVILRAMAGAEPAPIIPLVIADRLPLRNAAEMGADTDHHEPWLAARGCSVLVSRRRIVWKIGVAGKRGRKAVAREGLVLGDLGVRGGGGEA